jgi:hypothetical protein
MVTYAYTGALTDIGLGNLGGWQPEMTVRPKVSAFGPDGLVSDVRVPVALAAGAFTMNLIPSGDLTPVAGGTAGVPYVVEVGRFELAEDLQKIWHGTETWEFTAVDGGGNVGDMTDFAAAPNSVLVSLDPPPPGYKGWYLNGSVDDPNVGTGILEMVS